MKNLKFKILSIFCSFAILGIIATFSVSAMEKEKNDGGRNILNNKEDDINSKIIDYNKIDESYIEQFQDDFDFNTMKDIFNDKEDDKKPEDLKVVYNSVGVNKDNLYEKTETKKSSTLKDINLEKSVPFIPKKNRYNLNNNNSYFNNNANSINSNNNNLYNNRNFVGFNKNNNLYNNGNFINLNNNNLYNNRNFNMMAYKNNFMNSNVIQFRGNLIGLTLNTYKSKFGDILERIKHAINNKFNYAGDLLVECYYKFIDEYKYLFSNYSVFLDSYEYKIFEDCDCFGSTEEIDKKIEDIWENLEILYKNMCKNKITENLRGSVFELIKEKCRKIIIKKFEFYEKKIDIALKKIMDIFDKKDYEDKDNVIRFYDFWYNKYKNFSNNHEDKIYGNSEFKDNISELVAIMKGKIKEKADKMYVIRDFIPYGEKFDYFLKNSRKIIDKKTYGEKDDFVRDYDYWSSKYEDFLKYKNYEKKINGNDEFKNNVFELVKRITEKINEELDELNTIKKFFSCEKRFYDILKKLRRFINKKTDKKEYNIHEDKYNAVGFYNYFSNFYKDFLNNYGNKIYEKKINVNYELKKADEEIDKLYFINDFIFCETVLDDVLKNLMEIINKKTYENKDKFIKTYDYWRCRHIENLKENSKFLNKSLLDKILNDKIFLDKNLNGEFFLDKNLNDKFSVSERIVRIFNKMKLIAHIKSFVFCGKNLDYVLNNLIEIINKKTYENKDNFIRIYDYWRYSYEELPKVNVEFLDKNLNREFSKIGEIVYSKIKLIGIIKDLICKRGDFNDILKALKSPKKIFDKKDFNSKKFDYEKCLNNCKGEISEHDYLKVLKKDIDNIINNIEKTINTIYK